MKYSNFVSIDFETMTAKRTSACAIGMVKMRGGKIVDTFYSLIKPIPDDCTRTNTYIHHITMEMIKNEKTFGELFPLIKEFIGNDIIVCHNKSMEYSVLKQCMEYYHLSGIDIENLIDTYYLFKGKLVDLCDRYNIDMGNHHNAIDDAKSCAELLLRYDGMDYFQMRRIESNSKRRTTKREKNYTHCENSSVTVEDTLFYDKKIVITGTFKRFPNREDLKDMIYENFGGLYQSSPNSKTEIVIIGSEPGPSKMNKIEELIDNDDSIRLIYERELYQILNKIIGGFDDLDIEDELNDNNIDLSSPKNMIDYVDIHSNKTENIQSKPIRNNDMTKTNSGCLLTLIITIVSTISIFLLL